MTTPTHIHRAVVQQLTGLGTRDLDRLVAERAFPLPTRSRGTEFWVRSEVAEWLASGNAVRWLNRPRVALYRR